MECPLNMSQEASLASGRGKRESLVTRSKGDHKYATYDGQGRLIWSSFAQFYEKFCDEKGTFAAFPHASRTRVGSEGKGEATGERASAGNAAGHSRRKQREGIVPLMKSRDSLSSRGGMEKSVKGPADSELSNGRRTPGAVEGLQAPETSFDNMLGEQPSSSGSSERFSPVAGSDEDELSSKGTRGPSKPGQVKGGENTDPQKGSPELSKEGKGAIGPVPSRGQQDVGTRDQAWADMCLQELAGSSQEKAKDGQANAQCRPAGAHFQFMKSTAKSPFQRVSRFDPPQGSARGSEDTKASGGRGSFRAQREELSGSACPGAGVSWHTRSEERQSSNASCGAHRSSVCGGESTRSLAGAAESSRHSPVVVKPKGKLFPGSNVHPVGTAEVLFATAEGNKLPGMKDTAPPNLGTIPSGAIPPKETTVKPADQGEAAQKAPWSATFHFGSSQPLPYSAGAGNRKWAPPAPKRTRPANPLPFPWIARAASVPKPVGEDSAEPWAHPIGTRGGTSTATVGGTPTGTARGTPTRAPAPASGPSSSGTPVPGPAFDARARSARQDKAGSFQAAPDKAGPGFCPGSPAHGCTSGQGAAAGPGPCASGPLSQDAGFSFRPHGGGKGADLAGDAKREPGTAGGFPWLPQPGPAPQRKPAADTVDSRGPTSDIPLQGAQRRESSPGKGLPEADPVAADDGLWQPSAGRAPEVPPARKAPGDEAQSREAARGAGGAASFAGKRRCRSENGDLLLQYVLEGCGKDVKELHEGRWKVNEAFVAKVAELFATTRDQEEKAEEGKGGEEGNAEGERRKAEAGEQGKTHPEPASAAGKGPAHGAADEGTAEAGTSKAESNKESKEENAEVPPPSSGRPRFPRCQTEGDLAGGASGQGGVPHAGGRGVKNGKTWYKPFGSGQQPRHGAGAVRSESRGSGAGVSGSKRSSDSSFNCGIGEKGQWEQVSRNVRTATQQLLELQRWDPGTCCAAVFWTVWLLRKTRKLPSARVPRALNLLLFTSLHCVLPRVLAALSKKERDQVQVDAATSLLEEVRQSRGLFTTLRWGMLQEGIRKCSAALGQHQGGKQASAHDAAARAPPLSPRACEPARRAGSPLWLKAGEDAPRVGATRGEDLAGSGSLEQPPGSTQPPQQHSEEEGRRAEIRPKPGATGPAEASTVGEGGSAPDAKKCKWGGPKPRREAAFDLNVPLSPVKSPTAAETKPWEEASFPAPPGPGASAPDQTLRVAKAAPRHEFRVPQAHPRQRVTSPGLGGAAPPPCAHQVRKPWGWSGKAAGGEPEGKSFCTHLEDVPEGDPVLSAHEPGCGAPVGGHKEDGEPSALSLPPDSGYTVGTPPMFGGGSFASAAKPNKPTRPLPFWFRAGPGSQTGQAAGEGATGTQEAGAPGGGHTWGQTFPTPGGCQPGFQPGFEPGGSPSAPPTPPPPLASAADAAAAEADAMARLANMFSPYQGATKKRKVRTNRAPMAPPPVFKDWAKGPSPPASDGGKPPNPTASQIPSGHINPDLHEALTHLEAEQIAGPSLSRPPHPPSPFNLGYGSYANQPKRARTPGEGEPVGVGARNFGMPGPGRPQCTRSPMPPFPGSEGIQESTHGASRFAQAAAAPADGGTSVSGEGQGRKRGRETSVRAGDGPVEGGLQSHKAAAVDPSTWNRLMTSFTPYGERPRHRPHVEPWGTRECRTEVHLGSG